MPDFNMRTSETFNTEDALKNLSNIVIEKRLKNLNGFKTVGADEVHPLILKNFSNEFDIPLEIIFRKSIETGKIPNAWRLANVSPIFKRGSRLEPSNYRPVSLTSIVCKILEGLIRDQLMEYLLANN